MIVYGSRIRQARELAGLTQQELADAIGVDQSAIAQIETERYYPSAELLQEIGDKTGFLSSFFLREPVDGLPMGTLAYRARVSLSAKEQKAAYQYANVIFEQIDKMRIDNRRVKLPPMRIPRLEEPYKLAAQIARSELGLSPDQPIRNLINSLEKNGVIIITLPIFINKLDAFSTWATLDCERPVIVLSPNKPMDRMRFSISHELGHLVIPSAVRGQKNIKEIEDEADAFAGEFMTPESSMTNEIIKPVTLTSLAKLKGRWGVSIQSLVNRARELGKITPRQRSYLFSQIAAHGWMQREPSNLDPKPETTQVIRRIIESLHENTEEYADAMGLKAERAREIVLFA